MTKRTDRVQALLERFRPEHIPMGRRIFSNRNLRLGSLDLIGFDMDYTLAEYHVDVEELQVRMALERLVEQGYPKEALQLKYDPNFAIRGLIVDKRLGSILKMDTHRHISRAFHGAKPLPKERRRQAYRDTRIRVSSERFALVDTLFGIPETWLYAKLVDLMEQKNGSSKRRKKLRSGDYRQIFQDIRNVVDALHADQSLKTIICADLPRYINRDPELPATLHRLREAGRRLFLMTNSYGKYTTAVMTYLLDGARDEYPSWKDYFDITVVGSKKPDFFVKNTPFLKLGADMEPDNSTVTGFERGQIYQNGNLADFESFAGTGGDRILYVGDNLYGDILRSKKTSAWRTAMIVPELERELAIAQEHNDDFNTRGELETTRRQLDNELRGKEQLAHSLQDFITDRHGQFSAGDRRAFKNALDAATQEVGELRRDLNACLARIWHLNNRLAKAFNRNWGMLFKARAEHSIFGAQVEAYACIYTSRVSNLGAYSPWQYFRAPRDHMPHELVMHDLAEIPELDPEYVE